MKARNLVAALGLLSALVLAGGCSHNSASATDPDAARKAFTQGGAMPADVQAKMQAARTAAAQKYGKGAPTQ